MTGTFDRVAYMHTYNADYRKKNKDRLRVVDAEYRKKNKDKLKASKKVYRGRRTAHIANVVRANKLRNRYKITPEEYDLMLALQDGCCAICGNLQQAGKRLNVDHCHKSGRVRGLLCNTCNRGIGFFKDDTEILSAAIKYLKEHE